MKRIVSILIILLCICTSFALISCGGTEHTITFHTDGGSELASIVYQTGGEMALPAEPVKEGYTFGGWYTNSGFSTEFKNGLTYASDINLYAKWIIKQYTVTFESNGGSAVAAVTADYGAEMSAPEDPEKNEYRFGGWYLDDGTFAEAYTFSTMPAADVTLFAKWTSIYATYSITFVTNGGGSVAAITKTEGTRVNAPTAPTKSGYTFGGWYTDNNTFAHAYSFANMPGENLILYAKWTANYTITFVTNGGGTVAPMTRASGAQISAPAAPSKGDYVFGGWYTDNNTFAHAYTFSVMPGANLTVYAKWTEAPPTLLGLYNQYGDSFTDIWGDILFEELEYCTVGQFEAEFDTDLEELFGTAEIENLLILNEAFLAFECVSGANAEEVLADLLASEVGQDYTEWGYSFFIYPNSAVIFAEVFGARYIFSDRVEQVGDAYLSDDGEHLIRYFGKQTEYVIPSGVKTIESLAFSECNSLLSLTIPASVTEIELDALYYINKLVHITNLSGISLEDMLNENLGQEIRTSVEVAFLNTLTEDGDGLVTYEVDGTLYAIAFVGDEDVIDLTGKGIDKIYSHAFSGLEEITSITISESVTDIGYGAFSGNTALTALFVNRIVPPDVYYWMFDGCDLLRIYVPLESLAAYKQTMNWRLNSSKICVYNMNCTVTFDGNGGTLISGEEVQSVPYGAMADAPIYEKEGFILSWDWNISYYCIMEDRTVTAIWTAVYTISFHSNGGSAVDPVTVEEESQCRVPEDPEKEGYVFIGWFTDDGTFQDRYDFSTVPEQSFTLYAKWIAVSELPRSLLSYFNEYGTLYDTVWGGMLYEDQEALSYYTAEQYDEENAFSLAMLLGCNDIQSVLYFNDSFLALEYAPNADPNELLQAIENSYYYSFGNYVDYTIDPDSFIIFADFFDARMILTGHGERIGNFFVDDSGEHLIRYIGNQISDEIPSSITSIGDYAFSVCNLLSLTIPVSVTEIEDYAFESSYKLVQYTNLSEVLLDDLIPFYFYPEIRTSAEEAFSGVLSMDSDGLVTYDVEDMLCAISYFGDENVLDMSEKGIEFIYPYAFYKLHELTSVTIPSSTDYIGERAFYGCSALTAVFIETADPLALGEYVFDLGENLCIYVPLESILDYKNDSDWEEYADRIFVYDVYYEVIFDGDGGMLISGEEEQDVLCGGAAAAPVFQKEGFSLLSWDKEFYCILENTTVTAVWTPVYTITFNSNGGSEVNPIAEPSGEQISMPSVPEKEDYAFIGWYTDDGTFENRYSFSVMPEESFTLFAKWILESDLPRSLESYYDEYHEMFEMVWEGYHTMLMYIDDISLIEIILNIEGIRSMVYDGMSMTLECQPYADPEAVLAQINSAYGSNTYGIVFSIIPSTSIIITSSLSMDYILTGQCELIGDAYVSTDGKRLIRYVGEETAYEIPSGIEEIGYAAFENHCQLVSVTIPDSVTCIQENAFCDCSALTSVSFGNGVTVIGYCAFSNSGLTSVILPDSVRSIGDYAFEYCENLLSVTFGNRLRSIGSDAFYQCDNITSIVFAETAGWYRTSEEGATSGGTAVSLEDPEDNASFFTNQYCWYYWYHLED